MNIHPKQSWMKWPFCVYNFSCLQWKWELKSYNEFKDEEIGKLIAFHPQGYDLGTGYLLIDPPLYSLRFQQEAESHPVGFVKRIVRKSRWAKVPTTLFSLPRISNSGKPGGGRGRGLCCWKPGGGAYWGSLKTGSIRQRSAHRTEAAEGPR